MSHAGPLLLRVGEAAVVLGLSRGAIYSLIRSGDLPSLKIGRSRRILASDLEEWVRRRAAPAADVGLARTQG